MKALIKSFLNKPLTKAERAERAETIDALTFGVMLSFFAWPIFYCAGEAAGNMLASFIFA